MADTVLMETLKSAPDFYNYVEWIGIRMKKTTDTNPLGIQMESPINDQFGRVFNYLR